MPNIEELKNKIQYLIAERRNKIITSYGKGTLSAMKLTDEEIRKCQIELIEDPIIVNLLNQLIDIEKRTVRPIYVSRDIFMKGGK